MLLTFNHVVSKLISFFINGMLSVKSAKQLLWIEHKELRDTLYNLKDFHSPFLIIFNANKRSRHIFKKMKKNSSTDVNLWENNRLLFKTETANSCDSSGSHRSPNIQINNKGQSNRRRRQEGSSSGDKKVREVEKSNRKTRISQIKATQNITSNTIAPLNFLLQQNTQSNGFVRAFPSASVPPLPSHSSFRFFYESTALQHQLSNINFRRIDSSDESSSSQAKNADSNVIKSPTKQGKAGKDQKSHDLKRTWQLTNFGKTVTNTNGGKKPGFTFTLMSYNVLAQDLIEEHMYLYKEHNKKALVWEIRWSNLITEIKQLNPDILCLQEVQNSHRAEYYSKLKLLGYESVYKQRTGGRPDGCAIYYKKDIFSFIEYATVEFSQRNTSILNRDNVAIIIKLSPRSNPENHFVIATTHLLYNPRRQDVRLAQIQLLLAEIDRISYSPSKCCSNNSGTYVPVILTGDFNSLPQSAVYEFIVKGHLQYEDLALRASASRTGKTLVPNFLGITDHCQHEELLNKRLQNATLHREDELKLVNLQHSDRLPNNVNKVPANKTLFSSGKLTHHIAFKSVYEHSINDDPEGTTYQNEWITVDYIFYSGIKQKHVIKEDKLKLVGRYTLPTAHQLNNVRVPNFTYGSDHLSLLAKFKLEY